MTTDRIAIIGGGLAGLRAAERLRELGHTGPITMIGEEPHAPYNRPPLSKQVLEHKVHAQAIASSQVSCTASGCHGRPHPLVGPAGSPPPVGNFREAVPTVRSERPLLDLAENGGGN